VTDPDLTPAEIRDRITWLQQQRSQAANQLHARAAFMKPTVLTDAESAAIARKKLDERSRP